MLARCTRTRYGWRMTCQGNILCPWIPVRMRGAGRQYIGVLTLLREHNDWWKPVSDAIGLQPTAALMMTQLLCSAVHGN
jgi:hypothetical protein